MRIYLVNSNQKGISSCQLAYQVGITQKKVWFVLHRIREACCSKYGTDLLDGMTDIDAAYNGDRKANHQFNFKTRKGKIENRCHWFREFNKTQ